MPDAGQILLERLLRAGILEAMGNRVSLPGGWLAEFFSGAGAADSTRSDLSGVWGEKAILGLTGNIATGKSTVLSLLGSLGAEVIDADAVVHALREPGRPGHRALIEMLGEQILRPDGHIDIGELSAQAFSDPELLLALEMLFRPLVVTECERLGKQSAARVVVVEAIKLLEGGLKEQVDAVWVVDAPRAVQIQRLMDTRGMTREQAVLRIEAQAPQAEKIAQADVLINNAGDLDETRRQVRHAWSHVLSRLWRAGWLDEVLVRQWVAFGLDLEPEEGTVSFVYENLALIAGAKDALSVSDLVRLLEDD